MNKAELVTELGAHFGSKAEAARILDLVLCAIVDGTAREGKVTITGFGVFETVHKQARTVRNPKTGERLEAPETTVSRFRPGAQLVRAAARRHNRHR